jgi:hypothetical protein
VNGKIEFQVVGIQWGDAQGLKALEIQFDPEEKYLPVDNLQITDSGSWNFWTYVWTPQEPGRYLIRLRAKGKNVAARRLESGYYARSVEIDDI